MNSEEKFMIISGESQWEKIAEGFSGCELKGN